MVFQRKLASCLNIYFRNIQIIKRVILQDLVIVFLIEHNVYKIFSLPFYLPFLL